MTAFWLALPLLAVGFVAGILISLIQIVTSIQDTAFNAIPRLIAFSALHSGCLDAPQMTAYTVGILGDLSRYGR